MAEKILIVDDDLETLRLVGLMLSRQGYQILPASSGSQALALAAREKPDLILLDIMMPEIDGYEVTRQLRQNAETAHLPVLMFTAKNKSDDQAAGYEVGADDYLPKPAHPAELAGRIQALINRKQAAPVGKSSPARVIGCAAAKGGVGVSTLVLNLAAVLHQRGNQNVIAIEMRPGQGGWGAELGSSGNGLNKILSLDPAEINPTRVKNELTHTSFGVDLLLCAAGWTDWGQPHMGARIDALFREVIRLSDWIVVDLGIPVFPWTERVFEHCHGVVVMTEPMPATVCRTRMLLDTLREQPSLAGKPLSVMSLNRSAPGAGLSLSQMKHQLNQPVAQTIPYMPELAYQANLRLVPMVALEPDCAVAEQIQRLIDQMITSANP